MERLDSILKSVAGSSTPVSVASAEEDTSDRLIVTKTVVKQEQEVVKAEPEVRSRKVSGHERETDDDRKKQRRDRNRQAAARCRKRRLDLTCSLQVCSYHQSIL